MLCNGLAYLDAPQSTKARSFTNGWLQLSRLHTTTARLSLKAPGRATAASVHSIGNLYVIQDMPQAPPWDDKGDPCVASADIG
jgi:hypothetical protein